MVVPLGGAMVRLEKGSREGGGFGLFPWFHFGAWKNGKPVGRFEGMGNFPRLDACFAGHEGRTEPAGGDCSSRRITGLQGFLDLPGPFETSKV